MRDPSWISHSTLTKHQAGTSVRDRWPEWPVRYGEDLFECEKMPSHFPEATWSLAFLLLYLWSLVNWEDKLQYMIHSSPMPSPFFTLTTVSAVTLAPYYPPFLLILQGTLLSSLSLTILNYLSSCSICPFLHPSFFSWPIMKAQPHADGG